MKGMESMEHLIHWLRVNVDVFGFAVGALCFLITALLASARRLNFGLTFLFLFFSLFAGLAIANQEFLKQWILMEHGRKEKEAHEASPPKEKKPAEEKSG